ncbi:B-box_Zinc finger domain-containing protein [Hexamita inflata]|uniref:B-box Zinc finger domain-containing protein n=1 Tax=Hexamita inflata TaxID=28002 RepID=A0AA86R6W3_9EUKA|nr:B-box Zinc finger domain-containing protein [Hexamita inflata]
MKKRTLESTILPEQNQTQIKQSAPICDSCERNPASVFCFQCNGNICAQCDGQIHSNRLMRSHQRTAPFTPIKCKAHGNFTSMLCAHCQELICVNCLVEFHKGHQIQQLTESFEIVQQETNAALIRMNEKLSVIGRLDETLEQQLTGLRESCQQVLDSTAENFKILFDQLEQKQQEVTQNITSFQSQIEQELLQKQQLIQDFGKKLIKQRKNLMTSLEQTQQVDQLASNEQLYLQKLAQFVQNFINNQDEINEVQGENKSINKIIDELNREMEIPKQFCLDFASVQKFVEGIEGIYMCLQNLGE